MQMDGEGADSDAAAAPAHAAEGFAAAAVKPTTSTLPPTTVKGDSDTRLDLDASHLHKEQVKASCIRRILADSSITDTVKGEEIATLYECWDKQPLAVSSSRSSPPEPFHGLAKDQRQPAQSWMYSVELYFQAEYTLNPVAKAVTYLHGEARRWWQQVGSKTLSAASTFEMFSQAFLARFVKPSDSAKARAEIPHLSQVLCFALQKCQ